MFAFLGTDNDFIPPDVRGNCALKSGDGSQPSQPSLDLIVSWDGMMRQQLASSELQGESAMAGSELRAAAN